MGSKEDFLAHYGVPGMKWGIRRKNPSKPHSPGNTLKKTPAANRPGFKNPNTNTVNVQSKPGQRVKTTGGRGFNSSKDARSAAVKKQIAKGSSTDALSTKDLQEIVQRMNLEKQYNSLKPSEKSRARKMLETAAKAVAQQELKALKAGKPSPSLMLIDTIRTKKYQPGVAKALAEAAKDAKKK